jgi:two-component system, NarL family, captular synthesis response regulator RcsB
MNINVLLADDHPILVAGVAHVLSKIQGITVVGTAQNSTEVVKILKEQPCDILVTDYAMPGGEYGDGMNFVSYVRRNFPAIRIIVFTMIDNVAIVRELAKLGVHSVVNKRGNIDSVISAIYEVKSGRQYFPTDNTAFSIEMREVRGNKRKLLSKREAEVVRLYVSGLSITQIAEQLHRTKQTVSTQKVNAMRKLGISTDAELFRLAFESEGASAAVSPLDSEQ